MRKKIILLIGLLLAGIFYAGAQSIEKIGMKDTDIRTLEEKQSIKHFALGHIWVPEKQQFIRADSFPSSNYTIWLGNRKGPGRISSTAQDVLKWDQALYTQQLSTELLQDK